MNINPFGPTTPHYDSYDDFYKFFEVHPREDKDTSLVVFPPVQREQETIMREVPVSVRDKDEKEPR